MSKVIKLIFTEEQRKAVLPLLSKVAQLNAEGIFCMTAGQVFHDGMVVGILEGDRAIRAATEMRTQSASATELVGKFTGRELNS